MDGFQKFTLEEVPKSKWGIFYTGDAYIVLNVIFFWKSRENYKYKFQTKHLDQWDVHFWFRTIILRLKIKSFRLGKNASIDEIGVATIKAVEIDQARIFSIEWKYFDPCVIFLIAAITLCVHLHSNQKLFFNLLELEKTSHFINLIFTVQMLGGYPTQYREVQDFESALFLSYFSDGIRYLWK